MAKFDKKLAGILFESNLLKEDQRDTLVGEADRNNTSLTELLLERGLCVETDIIAAVADNLNFHPINLEKVTPNSMALDSLTEEQCKIYGVLPISKVGKVLTLAVANPFDVLILDDVKIVTGCEIVPVVSTDVAVKKAIKAAFAQEVDTEGQMDELLAANEGVDGALELKDNSELDEMDLSEDISSEGSPIVKMVNLLILQAIDKKSSDIHIEPFEKRLRVRFRVDGACQETVAPPKRLHPAIVSRIKIMASLDIAERRIPQDGKFQMRVKGRQVDFRTSVLPMVHGEKVCIRILDSSGLALSLESLGFEPEALGDFKWAVKQPYGMALVTGPTGSGKSTTLYSAVKEVLCVEDNITTVEDPVEYQLDGVNQVPVSDKRGLTFAAALRSILRQDPDTVMIGEIRDKETAEIAVKAALTGHLVFSTLHTNDAPSTITRLVDMGIDPFMVSSSVVLVSAQRLLRRLCKECKEKFDPPRERLMELGYKEDEIEGGTWFQAKGCGRCNGGYKGRFAILETMRMFEDVRRIVIDGGSALDIRGKALEKGMVTLRRCALLNSMRGITSIEEVLSMTQDEI
ncbi:MAG: Flp pilus assembly complex ATPase component TadA [Planctomycetes bacterium]|nr:Flp pilus assembly complex ATPase component TadA [Planctomycetota bacterium]